jgi:hypothetical protein
MSEARNLMSELDDAGTGLLNAVLGCVSLRAHMFSQALPKCALCTLFTGPRGGQPTPAAAGGGASTAGAQSIRDISLQVQREMYSNTRGFSPLCSKFTPVLL